MSCRWASAHDRAIQVVKPVAERINRTSKYLDVTVLDFAPREGYDSFTIYAEVYVKNQVGRVKHVQKNQGWEVSFFLSTRGDLAINVGVMQEDYYSKSLAVFDYGCDEDGFVKDVARVMNSFDEKELFEVDIKRRKVAFSMETPAGRRSKQEFFVDEFL